MNEKISTLIEKISNLFSEEMTEVEEGIIALRAVEYSARKNLAVKHGFIDEDKIKRGQKIICDEMDKYFG
jgi:hypothetical protein